MEKDVALLRGVNVGGKNVVSMPVLKSAFEKAGFCNISTYINSGNVIFSGEDTEDTDIETLQRRCTQIIMAEFNLNVPVAVISHSALADALSHAPEWWDSDKDSKHNAVFAISPATAESVMKELGEIKPEYEQADSHGQVIFWSAPAKTFTRTRLSTFVSAAACTNITIRNANTVKKLLLLSE